MLLRSSLAIRAPVAVVYDGGGVGGVYFGGASSNVNDTGLSKVTAIAGIDDEPVAFSDCLLFEIV